MRLRIVAVTLGLIAAFAAIAALKLRWLTVMAVLHVDRLGIVSDLADRTTRWAWAFSVGAVAFTGVALLIALIGGMIEVAATKRRIGALSVDPDLADRWSAVDWHDAFARSSVADQAEVMIAVLPAEGGATRRVIVDTPLLLSMARIWLDRLTLARTIAPLPAMLLALTAALIFFAFGTGDRWDAVAAAGAVGWFLMQLIQYLARGVLTLFVESAVTAATAAVQPMTAAFALEAVRPAAQVAAVAVPVAAAAPVRMSEEDATIIVAALSRVIREPLDRLAEATDRLGMAHASDAMSGGMPDRRSSEEEAELVAAALSRVVREPLDRLAEAARKLGEVKTTEGEHAGPRVGRAAEEEAQMIAAALSNVVWEPLGRLAEAAEKMNAAGAPRTRDQEIDSALSEIRAGIERLLASSGEG